MQADKAAGGESSLSADQGIEVPERYKKAVYVLFALVVFYVLVRGVVGAATRPFLFDETLTQVVSSQPSLHALWQALARAVDSQPPFFYLCERVVASHFTNKEIGLRLLSVVAFACTIVCVFAYVKKRSGEFIAFLCATLLLSTSLFHIYGIDARGYSLVIAWITFALVCYQRLPSPRWAALFGLSLFLAESLHYYAIFSMVPFGIAEAVLFLRTRRFRWQVWIALAFGTVPLAIFWPMLSGLKAYYSAHLWTHYSLSSIPPTYGSFFLTGGALGGAMAAVSAVAVIFSLRRNKPEHSAVAEYAKNDPSEPILILSMLALPLVVYVATSILHGAMLDRYVLLAIIGISLAMETVLRRSRAEIIVLFAVSLFSVVGSHEYSFWRSNWRHPFLVDSPAPPVENFVQKSGRSDLPVVIPDGINYLALAHYASPSFAKELVYLVDEQKAVTYIGTDSIEKGLLALRPYTPLQVVDFLEFTSARREFLLYVEEPRNGFDWLTLHLSRAATLQMVAMEQNRRLYLVTMKRAEPAN
jgi:4-amino-4-deoxy-L-arabinose transferase-like glycosyltransferase